ncbi:MAG: VRR-NUC domain-containing protein [Acutalibacter muris]|nr:VRR-NUC domain-containing protein [Acutalibacter muris]
MEKTVEQYLRKQVKKAGGLALKLVCPGFTGVPDRLILLPGGQMCFAETKDAGKTPRLRQRRVHDKLRELGFLVFVPDSKAAVDSMMACILGDPL